MFKNKSYKATKLQFNTVNIITCKCQVGQYYPHTFGAVSARDDSVGH